MHPIILGVLLVPMLIALAIGVAVGWAFWSVWTGFIENFVVDHVSLSWIAGAFVLALLAPMVILPPC